MFIVTWLLTKMLKGKRQFIYVLACLAILYFFFSFIRLLATFERGRYLTVRLTGMNPIKVYYSEMSQIDSTFRAVVPTVVLLYTPSMKTRKWEWSKTPSLLKEAGYRVLCIHLPNIPDDGKELSYPLKGGILADVLEQLKALDCILVAPSKTGSYALPVVIRGGYDIRAFVAISPLDSSHQFTRREYEILQTPTLILYGGNYKSLSTDSMDNLNNIPNKEVAEVKGAGRDFLFEMQDTFNRILLQYLEKIKKPISMRAAN